MGRSTLITKTKTGEYHSGSFWLGAVNRGFHSVEQGDHFTLLAPSVLTTLEFYQQLLSHVIGKPCGTKRMFSMSPIPLLGPAPNITAARERAERKADKLFRGATLPVYTADERIPDQIGSCIIIRISGSPFLLTASHVIDECEAEGLFVGAMGAFIPIRGDASITAKIHGKRSDDHYDVAVIPLEGDLLEKFNEIPVVAESMIDWNGAANPGHLFMAIGYPNSRNKISYRGGTKITPAVISHTDAIVSDNVTAKRMPGGGQHHLFLRYERRAIDAIGDEQNAIKPRGLSGGPLINLGKLSSPDVLENRKSTTPMLAAIVTERGVGLNLVCTKMAVVREVLRKSGRI